MITFDDKLRARDNVFAREFDGEMVLLDLDRGVYYGLDAIGTNVWKGMTAGKSLRDTSTALLGEYDVEESRLLNDVVALASDWLDKELVERIE